MRDALNSPTLFGEAPARRCAVLLPRPLVGPLDYRLPAGEDMPPLGSLVRVPLSGRTVTGVVWGEGDGDYPLEKLKMVESSVAGPPLSEDLVSFVNFVSRYTLAQPGAVLRMVLSSPAALAPAPVRSAFYANTRPSGLRMTTARQSVLEAAERSPGLSASNLADLAGVSDAVVRGLEKAGALTKQAITVDEPFPEPDPMRAGPELRAEQRAAADAIVGALGRFETLALEGVTGSGKTEVYFELVAGALKAGQQVLVMVPEIALTSQWLARFEDCFGCEPVVWHSDIGEAGRRRAWAEIRAGRARVVVGARSSLFLPFADLGAVIVDEEHDPSFKQEEGVIYHARDMAVVRAREAGCPVVLASATLSLETRVNAAGGRYRKLELRQRHGAAILPEIKAIDMRAEGPPPGEWISPPLRSAITARLEAGEQVMLYLNRRGYAPLTLCRTCGHRLGCPHCSAWLVEHRFQNKLQCHQCGYESPSVTDCPSCKSEDSMAACGPGVERLFEEVIRLFADARISVMTSDTLSKPSETAALVDAVAKGAIDIVIGTQLMTKGYHFPMLTLVGVIDADLGLRGGDLRAGERTYQQLTQVAGRAGRAERPGQVMLQTYEPNHPVVSALVEGDVEGFLALEEEMRERHAMPPYGRLVAIVLSGPDEAQVTDYGLKLARTAPAGEGLSVLGPAPAPITRIRGQYRVRLLMHAAKTARVQTMLKAWLGRAGKAGPVRVKVDVDPYSFL